MEAWLQNHPLWTALLRVILWVVPILLLLVPAIWFERRLLGWIQDRIGPNRVGPFGLLQPIADITKLVFKEEIVPIGVDRFTYVLAPLVSLATPVLLGAAVPFGPHLGLYAQLTPISDVNIGVLYLLSTSSLGVYGLVLAGYSGNNKYSLMGGLRASAQLISYELAMGMSIGAIVVSTGSLKFSDIVTAQTAPFWQLPGSVLENWNVLTPFGAVAAAIFLICMFAETNRPPFDLPEAENELVAGYHTEYSSSKFVSFLMGEYTAMVVFGTVFATLFLGGYNFLPVDWAALARAWPAAAGALNGVGHVTLMLGPVWLLGKACGAIVTFIWVRGSLPRLRYDQLMSLGWKTLLPLATANMMVAALWVVAEELYGPLVGMAIAIGAMLLGLLCYLNVVAFGRRRGDPLAPRSITLVDSGRASERAKPDAAGAS